MQVSFEALEDTASGLDWILVLTAALSDMETSVSSPLELSVATGPRPRFVLHLGLGARQHTFAGAGFVLDSLPFRFLLTTLVVGTDTDTGEGKVGAATDLPL